MPAFFSRLTKYLPTLLLAFVMASAVWISAVTQADPNEESTYPQPLPITLVGQDPGLILTNDYIKEISLTLIAPHSIWTQLLKNTDLVKVAVDLSGLGAGTHTLKVQVTVGLKPVEIVGSDPSTINVTLEKLGTRSLPVNLILNGSPAVGYELGVPTLSQTYVTISGPDNLVNQVNKITSTINANGVDKEIHQNAVLQARDIDDNVITGLTITPTQVAVVVPVTQLGGYQNVVVKVVVTGQVRNGYRVTNISVHPAAITVFSSNPAIVASLPGYIETIPIDLTDATDDIDLQASLNLPEGVTIVGNQTVEVQVGIAAIEGSITLSDMPVQIVNLGPGLAGSVSPEKVDIILSGPLLLLDQITSDKVHISVDMTGQLTGNYQVTPTVVVDIPSILVESVLPESIQVTVFEATPTPVVTAQNTLTITLTVTLAPTLTPTP
jgi:YbbR domain-containing protein